MGKNKLKLFTIFVLFILVFNNSEISYSINNDAIPVSGEDLRFIETGNFGSNSNVKSIYYPMGFMTNSTHYFVKTDYSILTYDHSFNYISEFTIDTAAAIDVETNGTHFFVAALTKILVYNYTGYLTGTYDIPGNTNLIYFYAVRIEWNTTHLFVCSEYTNQVHIFKEDGNYVGYFGNYDGTNGVKTTDIDTNATHIIIGDAQSNSILVHKFSGELVKTINGQETTNSINTVSFDTSGDIITSNLFEIKVFSSFGILIRSFGQEGTGDLEFKKIFNIYSNDTHFFVCDSRNNRIQIIDKLGNFAKEFGDYDSEILAPKDIVVNGTHIFIVDENKFRVSIFNYNMEYVGSIGSFGSGDGQFIYPVAITKNDTHFLVADGTRADVQVFDSNGVFVGKFGQYGSGNGEFEDPLAICMNENYIYVSDYWRDDIQIFDLSFNYISKITATNKGLLNAVSGIAANSTHLLVGDLYYDRIAIFDQLGSYVGEITSNTQSLYAYDIVINNDLIYISEYSGYVSIYKTNGDFYHKQQFPFLSYKKDGTNIAISGNKFYIFDEVKTSVRINDISYDKPNIIEYSLNDNKVYLNWSEVEKPNNSTFLGYQIYKTNPEYYTLDPYQLVSDSNFSEIIEPNKTYKYQISAVYSNIETSRSVIVQFSYTVASGSTSQTTSTSDSDTSQSNTNPSQTDTKQTTTAVTTNEKITTGNNNSNSDISSVTPSEPTDNNVTNYILIFTGLITSGTVFTIIFVKYYRK